MTTDAMNMGESELIAVPFDPIGHAELVRSFDCGHETHERELATWIQQDAAEAILLGTKVWLYATVAKEVIGYGSLGVTRWNYPDTKIARVVIALIPAVAIQKQFWGKPDGPRENRYSAQILNHLIIEAANLALDAPILGLFVHPENQRARKLYERAGFLPFSKVYFDKSTKVTYTSMIRLLAK